MYENIETTYEIVKLLHDDITNYMYDLTDNTEYDSMFLESLFSKSALQNISVLLTGIEFKDKLKVLSNHLSLNYNREYLYLNLSELNFKDAINWYDRIESIYDILNEDQKEEFAKKVFLEFFGLFSDNGNFSNLFQYTYLLRNHINVLSESQLLKLLYWFSIENKHENDIEKLEEVLSNINLQTLKNVIDKFKTTDEHSNKYAYIEMRQFIQSFLNKI